MAKALLPMEITEVGMEMEVREEQEEKTPSLMAFKEVGMETAERA